jgi:hypothetical protein
VPLDRVSLVPEIGSAGRALICPAAVMAGLDPAIHVLK